MGNDGSTAESANADQHGAVSSVTVETAATITVAMMPSLIGSQTWSRRSRRTGRIGKGKLQLLAENGTPRTHEDDRELPLGLRSNSDFVRAHQHVDGVQKALVQAVDAVEHVVLNRVGEGERGDVLP